ncbi:MAG: hypothetical protein AB8F94_01720 [Saprospiraceae bacterium]
MAFKKVRSDNLFFKNLNHTLMLFIKNQSSFTTEVLNAITQFANGNVYVAFTVLITILSAILIYVAIKKEKFDKKFFPILWFFLITNFVFSGIISMVTLPLQKEAKTVHQEYDKLRGIIDKLEEVSNVDQQNVNFLLNENKSLRETLLKLQTAQNEIIKKGKKKKPLLSKKIVIPDEPQLLKTEKSFQEIKQNIKSLDSIHSKGKIIDKKNINPPF